MKQRHRPHRRNEEEPELDFQRVLHIDQSTKSRAGFNCGYCRDGFERGSTPRVEVEEGAERLYHQACWKEWKGAEEDLLVSKWEVEDELEEVQAVLNRAYMGENEASSLRVLYHTVCAIAPCGGIPTYAGEWGSRVIKHAPEIKDGTWQDLVSGSLIDLAQMNFLYLIAVSPPVGIAAYASIAAAKAGFIYTIDKKRRKALRKLDDKKSQLEEKIKAIEAKMESKKVKNLKD